MAKTHAEFLNPCAICLGNNLQIDRLERDDNFFVTCIPCGVFTSCCGSRQEAIDHWNSFYSKRVNKHADFLEELKIKLINEIKELAQFVEFGWKEAEGGKRACELILNKIKQFETKLEANDEKT